MASKKLRDEYDIDTGSFPRNYIVVDCRGQSMVTICAGMRLSRVYLLGFEWCHAHTLEDALASAVSFSNDGTVYRTLDGGGFCVFEYVNPGRSARRRKSITAAEWLCVARCVGGRVVAYRSCDMELMGVLGYA